MAVHQGRRRGIKSFIVEPYKQVKLGLMFLLVNCVFAILILGVFGYYVIDMYSAVATLYQLSGQDNQLAFEKFSVPIFVGSGLLFLFFITTLFVSIRYTHEIYGPLVSINRFLDEALAGQVPRKLNLRPSDQLQELASKLNILADTGMTGGDSGAPAMPSSAIGAIKRSIEEMISGRRPSTIHWRESDKWSDEVRELAAQVNKLGETSYKGKG